MALTPDETNRMNGEAARRAPGPAEEGPALDQCPTCNVSGDQVYVAAEHPVFCTWMMKSARRCAEHDELLMPGETMCPFPEISEDWADPHNRTGVR